MQEKKEILKLKKMLPWGSHAEIAENTGYTIGYVSNVLNGKQEINPENIAIIEYAQKMVLRSKNIINKKLNSLNTFLSENKA